MRIIIKSILFLVIAVSGSVVAHGQTDWRSEIGVFRVGLQTGDQRSIALARAEPFRIALEEALEMEVEFYPGRNTQSLIDALQSDRIEYAILSSSAYGLAWTLCECVEPIAIPRSRDNEDSYHAIIISRTSSSQSIKSLEGKVVAELAPGSLSQSLMVRYLIGKEGIKAETIDFRAMESNEETLKAFAEGQFDALVGWSSLSGSKEEGYSRGTLRLLADLLLDDPTNYQIVWQSPPLPHRPHVTRLRLPGEAKEIIRNFLLDLLEQNPIAYDSIEHIYGGGFTTVTHERYKVFTDFMDVSVL